MKLIIHGTEYEEFDTKNLIPRNNGNYDLALFLGGDEVCAYHDIPDIDNYKILLDDGSVVSFEELPPTQSELLQEHESWFEWYDRQVMQALRQKRRGRNVDLTELDDEAEERAREMSRLRRSVTV